MIPQQFIEDLNRDADLAGIIGTYVKLERKGSSFVGLCPFHKEKTPSFNVVPAKGFYHCFGCGCSGNALKFLMEQAHSGDFLAAVEDLAKRLGRSVKNDGYKQAHVRERDALESAAIAYESYLRTSKVAREYLKGRGLTRKIAQRYRLGYAPKSGGLENEASQDMLAAGLMRRSDSGTWPYFRDRIMFPICDLRDKVVGFGARSLGSAEPKYLNSSESPWFAKGNIVYGLAAASAASKEFGYIIAVEGYMDVVMLAQHDIGCAVATMGTAATERQLRTILTRCERLIFCFDGDDAGQRAASKAVHNIMPALADGKKVEFVFLPQGDDPDSYVRANGRDAMLSLLEDPKSCWDLGQMLHYPHTDASAHKDDSALVRQGAELIERIDQQRAPYLYEILYKQFADWTGISASSLKHAAKRTAKPAEAAVPRPTLSQIRKMDSNDAFQALACLHAVPDLAAKHDFVPYSKSSADGRLVSQVMTYLREAQHSDAEPTVAAFMENRRLDALRGQLDEQVDFWRQAKESDKAIAHRLADIEKRSSEEHSRQRKKQQQVAEINKRASKAKKAARTARS